MGTRFTCQDWLPLEENVDLKECILLCMEEYRNSGVKSDEWVSVEKELPEVGEYVLINLGSDTVLKGRLMRNGWTAFFADGEQKAGEIRAVTHWRKLPAPPKVNQENGCAGCGRNVNHCVCP